MNPIFYLDAYSLVCKKEYKVQEIYNHFCISKTKQKDYPILDGTILFPVQSWGPVCEQTNLDIVYEDETLLVINKPPFILVHSDGTQKENLQDQVNAYLFAQGWPHKAQAIHRLDYETTGLLLFCKNPFFQAYYDSLFATSHPKKEYYALVKKNFPYKEKEVHASIGRDRHDAKKMRISPSGKEAHSYIKRIKISSKCSLVRIQITTGKKHQIRVHLASLHFPILNDALYGQVENNDGLLLQHYKISFPLPTGNTIQLELPMDLRFQSYLQ